MITTGNIVIRPMACKYQNVVIDISYKTSSLKISAVFLTLLHLITRYITFDGFNKTSNWQREIAVVLLIFVAAHLVGNFNRYLVERAQRETFMETRLVNGVK